MIFNCKTVKSNKHLTAATILLKQVMTEHNSSKYNQPVSQKRTMCVLTTNVLIDRTKCYFEEETDGADEKEKERGEWRGE